MKTCALAGLAVAAAGGVLITGSPAYAGALVQGHRHHHSRFYWSHRTHNRNINLNRNYNRNRVIVRVVNRNVNTSFVDRERGGFHDDDFGLFRRCHFGCNRFGRFDRFDRFDDDFADRDDDRGDRFIIGNDIRLAGDRD